MLRWAAVVQPIFFGNVAGIVTGNVCITLGMLLSC